MQLHLNCEWVTCAQNLGKSQDELENTHFLPIDYASFDGLSLSKQAKVRNMLPPTCGVTDSKKFGLRPVLAGHHDRCSCFNKDGQ